LKGYFDSGFLFKLLHVAMMNFGFDSFVTADKQQHDFAVRAGYPATFLPP